MDSTDNKTLRLNIELARYMTQMDKKRAEAVGYYVKAYQINPTDTDVLLDIAGLYGQLRDHSKGLDSN